MESSEAGIIAMMQCGDNDFDVVAASAVLDKARNLTGASAVMMDKLKTRSND